LLNSPASLAASASLGHEAWRLSPLPLSNREWNGYMASLKDKVASGTAINASTQVIRVVTQFAIVLPILTRLLTPEEYGIVAMGMSLVLFFMVFNDFGIASAMVRQKDPSPELWSSAVVTNTGIGITLAILAYFGADFVAGFYREPRVAPVMQALSAVLFMHCLTITPFAWMQRELRFTQMALVQVGAQLAGSATAVIAAFMGAGLWALVIDQFVNQSLRAIGIWSLARVPVVGRFDWPGLARLLPFSLNILASKFTTYVSTNADDLLIGRYLDASVLGLYTRAYQVMLAPVRVLAHGAGFALLPALSTMQNEPARAGAAYLKGVKSLAMVGFPMMLGISALSGPIVRFVFGEAWAATAPVLAALAPVGAMQTVTVTHGALFMAIGRADIMFRWSLALNTLAIIGFAVGLNWGVTGVAIGFLLANAVLFIPSMWVLLRQVGQPIATFLADITPIIVSSCVMMAGVWGLSGLMSTRGWPDYAQILVCVPAGMAIYGTLMLALDRRGSGELLKLGHGLLSRAR